MASEDGKGWMLGIKRAQIMEQFRLLGECDAHPLFHCTLLMFWSYAEISLCCTYERRTVSFLFYCGDSSAIAQPLKSLILGCGFASLFLDSFASLEFLFEPSFCLVSFLIKEENIFNCLIIPKGKRGEGCLYQKKNVLDWDLVGILVFLLYKVYGFFFCLLRKQPVISGDSLGHRGSRQAARVGREPDRKTHPHQESLGSVVEWSVQASLSWPES